MTSKRQIKTTHTNYDNFSQGVLQAGAPAELSPESQNSILNPAYLRLDHQHHEYPKHNINRHHRSQQSLNQVPVATTCYSNPNYYYYYDQPELQSFQEHEPADQYQYAYKHQLEKDPLLPYECFEPIEEQEEDTVDLIGGGGTGESEETEEAEDPDKKLEKYYIKYWNTNDKYKLPFSNTVEYQHFDLPQDNEYYWALPEYEKIALQGHNNFWTTTTTTTTAISASAAAGITNSSNNSSSLLTTICSSIRSKAYTDSNSNSSNSNNNNNPSRRTRIQKRCCFVLFLLLVFFIVLNSLLQQISIVVQHSYQHQQQQQIGQIQPSVKISESIYGGIINNNELDTISDYKYYLKKNPSGLAEDGQEEEDANNNPRGLKSASTTTDDDINNLQLQRRLPQVIIIGARKCGTRALIDMLNLHPQVEKAPNEVHFFDRDDNYSKGLDWYRSLMPETTINQIGIEKSPSYFVTPEVPERIYGMNSSIKLLLIVREPVTRVISDYTQIYGTTTTTSSNANYYSTASSSGTSSAAATATGAARNLSLPLNLNKLSKDSYSTTKSSSPSPSNSSTTSSSSSTFPPRLEDLILNSDGTINLGYKAIRISLYSRYLQRWLDVFPLSQIHVIDGEALIRDPYSVLKSVETFLGLQPKLQPENFYYNSTKGFYCWRKLGPSSSPSSSSTLLSSSSPPFINTNSNSSHSHNSNSNNNTSTTNLHCLNESKGRPHPIVDRQIIQKLRRFYSTHNLNFYDMVGKDFTWPQE